MYISLLHERVTGNTNRKKSQCNECNLSYQQLLLFLQQLILTIDMLSKGSSCGLEVFENDFQHNIIFFRKNKFYYSKVVMNDYYLIKH